MRIAAGLIALLALAPPLRAQDPLLAARTKGSATAPIVVYEMSDFQCPWCRRHALETWPTLLKEYVETGKVRWTFINFPLTQIHPNAAAAAEFAMCAAQEGAFWRVHDLLYLYQEKWGPLKDPAPFLITFADSAGLQKDKLTACLTSGVMRAGGAGRRPRCLARRRRQHPDVLHRGWPAAGLPAPQRLGADPGFDLRGEDGQEVKHRQTE